MLMQFRVSRWCSVACAAWSLASILQVDAAARDARSFLSGSDAGTLVMITDEAPAEMPQEDLAPHIAYPKPSVQFRNDLPTPEILENMQVPAGNRFSQNEAVRTESHEREQDVAVTGMNQELLPTQQDFAEVLTVVDSDGQGQGASSYHVTKTDVNHTPPEASLGREDPIVVGKDKQKNEILPPVPEASSQKTSDASSDGFAGECEDLHFAMMYYQKKFASAHVRIEALEKSLMQAVQWAKAVRPQLATSENQRVQIAQLREQLSELTALKDEEDSEVSTQKKRNTELEQTLLRVSAVRQSAQSAADLPKIPPVLDSVAHVADRGHADFFRLLEGDGRLVRDDNDEAEEYARKFIQTRAASQSADIQRLQRLLKNETSTADNLKMELAKALARVNMSNTLLQKFASSSAEVQQKKAIVANLTLLNERLRRRVADLEAAQRDAVHDKDVNERELQLEKTYADEKRKEVRVTQQEVQRAKHLANMSVTELRSELTTMAKTQHEIKHLKAELLARDGALASERSAAVRWMHDLSVVKTRSAALVHEAQVLRRLMRRSAEREKHMREAWKQDERRFHVDCVNVTTNSEQRRRSQATISRLRKEGASLRQQVADADHVRKQLEAMVREAGTELVEARTQTTRLLNSTTGLKAQVTSGRNFQQRLKLVAETAEKIRRNESSRLVLAERQVTDLRAHEKEYTKEIQHLKDALATSLQLTQAGGLDLPEPLS